MKASYIIGGIVLWVVAVILEGIITMQSGAFSAQDMAIFEGLLTPTVQQYDLPGSGVLALAQVSWNYLNFFFGLFAVSFTNLFAGSFSVLQLFTIFPLFIVIIWGLIMAIRGVSTP